MPRPAPVTINHPLLFGVVTVVWLVGFLVLAAGRAFGFLADAGDWLWITAAGTLLGVGATIYARFSWRARA